MGIPGSLMVIAITWWLVFFTLLPIGIRSQLEEGNVTPGSEPSAPVAPKLMWKSVASLVVSLVIWAGLYSVIEYHLLTLDDLIPWK